jgi:hypothetical protein
VLGSFSGKSSTQLRRLKSMTAKDKIDKFIGELPDLTKVNKSLNHQYSEDNHINFAYWKGYIDAKLELREKLYKKENITIEKKVESNTDWDPDFNLTIFGERVYGNK